MTFEELRASARKNAAEIDKKTGAERLGTSIQKYETTQKAQKPPTPAAPSLTKAKRDTSTATVNRAPVQRWENQVRQAQADLDTDVILRLNRKLKEERARQGKQTLGDRVSDVASAVFGGSGSSLTNLAGFASNLVQDPEADRRNIAQAQKALQTGRTSDGRPINDAQRKTLEDSISRLSAHAEKLESPDSFTNRVYQAADRMADTGAAYQESAKKGLGKVGSTIVDAATSMGQSTLDAALGAATGTGMLPFVARSLGGGTQEARRGGADLDGQLLYGSAQAAKEYVTEKLFGLSAPQRLIGGGSFDDAIEKGIRRATERLAKTPGGQKLVGGLMTWLAGGATEGLEEGIGSVIENALISPNLRDWDPDRRTVEEKISDGLYDMLVGGISGLMGVTNLAQYQVSPEVRAQAAASRAETSQDARRTTGQGTNTPQAQNAAEAAQTGSGNVFTEAGQTAPPADVSKLDTSPTGETAVNENGLTALSPLERENLSSGKKNKVVSTFGEAVSFVRNALRNKQSSERAYLGKIPDSVAQMVKEQTGVDISGFGAVLHSDNIRHIMKQHGDPLMEPLRGQIPLTAEHIAEIPGILSNPDRVYLSPETDSRGRKVLGFEKNIGGNYITMQAVSDGTHSIQTDTIFVRKEKNPQGTESYDAGLSTDPAHNARSVPPQGSSIDFTIPQGVENVNPSGGDGLGAAAPVQAGRATTIQRPYQGTKPVQAQKSAAVVQVDPGSVRTAQNRIEGARKMAEDPMSAGQGFKSILKRSLQSVFRSAKGVEVEGVTFEGKPYLVDINHSVLGKVVSDQNLSAEKISLLDMLPDIVRNGEYVGSGEYEAHGSKTRPVSRYDYFETPVSINGQTFIARFDVEVLPDVNNFRTHQIVKMDLTPVEGSLAGPAPAAASGESGPVEGTSSLNADSTIPQGTENVNPSGGDGLGAADAGSLNSDYDRLQAQSDTFHPEGANAARPVDVPTRDFEGRNISKAASTILGAEILDGADVARLEQMVADGGFSFDAIRDKDALGRAQDTLKAIGFDRALERYTQAAQSNTAAKDNTVLGQVLMMEAARGGNRRALAEIASLYARNSTNIAQAMQAQKILRQLGPADRLYALQKSVNELADKYNVDIELDQTALEAFMNAESEEARQAAEARLIQAAAEQLPSSFRAKYDAVRYLAMLGNPRTHIRNIVGNLAFQVPTIAKNRVGALAELGAQALGADVERTKSFIGANPFGALAKEARADWANAKEFLEGGKYSDGQTTARDIESQVKPFQNSNPAGKFVGWLAEKNGAALEWEDNLAKHWIYSQSLAGYLKANGVKSISEASPELLNRARNYAAQEALRNTFNDRNDVSDFVAKLGNLRNSKNKTARAASYITEGILPFKRTPANVAVRAVEYSPVGAATSIVDLINKGVRGQATAETLVKGLDRLAAGLSGSALLGLGFLASGMITGGEDEDEDQRKFNDLTGHQTYAIETKDGKSVTLDWLAPSAIPFFMGVELAHAMQDGGVSLEDTVNALKNMSEPMLEMSMLQGLNDVFENAAYAQQHGGSVLGSALVSAASSYLTQIFPTFFGQVERISEDKRMTTYSDENSKVPKDLQFFLGKLSQKVPFWDYQQIPYLDAWGREEDTGDPVARVFNNLFNPAYASQVTVDAVEQELQRVADVTGVTSVFPDRAPRYFTVNKERKNLTAEEYQKYAQKRGALGAETLKQMMDSPGYQRLSDEKKVEAIKDVYQYADSLAKMEVSSYRPGDGTVAAGVLKSMLPAAGYILYQLNRDRNGDGKVSKMESTQTLLELPGLNDKQRGQAWSAFNDSTTAEVRNPFTGVLAKDGMAPEDVQTAWDIYGRSGTKEEPYTQGQKKQDLREELDLTAAEVNRIWNLMKRAANMG